MKLLMDSKKFNSWMDTLEYLKGKMYLYIYKKGIIDVRPN